MLVKPLAKPFRLPVKFLREIVLALIMVPVLHPGIKAQDCTSTLGYPVVYLTFGKGQGVGAPLDSGVTTFKYVTGCPADGQYTITDTMTYCYTNNWHRVIKDHTGDAHGRFMVANASIVPDDFFVQRIDNLCGGTTYEFSAWLLNMISNSGIAPNIDFIIEQTDGTVLKRYNTGDIPITSQPTWKQYPFYFNMPQNISSVVIRMRNNAPGGYGNDVALDDITFRPAGPGIRMAFADRPGTTATVCQPASNSLILLGKTDVCYVNTSYQWQQSTDNGLSWANINGATTGTYNLPLLPVGTYLYRTLVAGDNHTDIVSCRVISDMLTVNVTPATASQISISSPVTTTCPGVPITFTALPVNPGPSPVYQWQVNGVNAGVNSVTFSPDNLKNNDMVSVTLTGPNTCSPPVTSNTITVNVADPIKGVLITASANNICKNTPVTFSSAVNATTANLNYQWQINGRNAADTTSTFTSDSLNNNDVVTCLVYAKVMSCALPVVVSSNIITMAVQDTAVITLKETNYTIYHGGSVQLQVSTNTSGLIYSWSPATGLSQADIAAPIALPDKTTAYKLTVTTPFGCTTASAAVTVKVLPIFMVTPNTFSPNGDGINDTWNVKDLTGYPNCTVDIYTRAGVLVFHSVGYSLPWDGIYNGKVLPVATYYYVIDLKNGTKPYTGYVSLL